LVLIHHDEATMTKPVSVAEYDNVYTSFSILQV
jgi:hypothetical protein